MKAEVLQIIRMEGIPSASALAEVGGKLLVACDDSPWMFTVDHAGRELSRLRLFPGDGPRIPKAEKADLESMVILGNEDGVLIFGSGSKLPLRATIVYWPTSGLPQVLRPLSFYEAIMSQCGIAPEDLNIEGAACHGWDLYLLNRGGNRLISLNANALLAHLLQGGPVPEMTVHAFELPADTGHQAGFSGATMLDKHKLLFCASVEATSNWVDDGEVLGSYVGLLDPRKPDQPCTCVPVMHAGERYIGKIEAIELHRKRNGNAIEAWAVTDDDAGGSDLLLLRIDL